MGLKEGTLESLVESSGGLPTPVADSVFPQMLQALDCLAYNGIVHRDVKPENILYVSRPGGEYQFQLGDFGLCNRIIDAATFAGIYLYMPPEMLQEGDQTHKVDVWSLFVTMLWILDAGEFRQRSNRFKTVAEVQRAVLSAALNMDSVSKIREMAAVNPKERASAAQMLVKYYNGVGLSTPRNQVPALISSPSPAITAARAPVPAIPALTTRTTQTKRRGFQKNRNIFAVAAPYRVEKARDPFSAQQAPRRLQDLRLKPDKS
ncbi:kinase-like domain-containing protein [Bisporella sp. PMI_857]|nr:kinase-like domain-containing protein [Bisporella sp. PMI_857]